MVGTTCDKGHIIQPHVIHGISRCVMATSLETESGDDGRTMIHGFYGRSKFREAKFSPIITVLVYAASYVHSSKKSKTTEIVTFFLNARCIFPFGNDSAAEPRWRKNSAGQ